MNYYGYYGNNDYRNYLMHFGRKGMKWGKSIFGSDEEYARNRAKATSDIDRAKVRMRLAAGRTSEYSKYIGETGKNMREYRKANNINGLYANKETRSTPEYQEYLNRGRMHGVAIGATVGNAIRTAGAAAEYGVLVAERAVADAVRSSYKWLKQAKGHVIDFGKNLLSKVLGGIKKIKNKLPGTVKAIGSRIDGSYAAGKKKAKDARTGKGGPSVGGSGVSPKMTGDRKRVNEKSRSKINEDQIYKKKEGTYRKPGTRKPPKKQYKKTSLSNWR